MLLRVVVLVAILAGNLLVPMAQVPMVYAEEQVFVTPTRIGTHSVPEGSGIVASRVYSNIYWMISDWGNPANLYAVDSSGKTVKSFKVDGATNGDWEDIAIDENNNIWIAEIGDNDAVADERKFYKVAEPDPYGSKTSVAATAYKFTYPDGSRDANAAFVWQGIPYVVDTHSDKAKVYKLPVLDPSSTVTAQLVATYTGAAGIRGADISPDGKRLALVSANNDYALVIERDSSSTDVKDFFSSPTRQWRISFDPHFQEGITFIPGKYDFIMEKESGGMWKVTEDQYNPTATPPTPPPTPPPTVTYTLKFDGYDFDSAKEMSVILNGQTVAIVPSTSTPANDQTWVAFTFDITKFAVKGTNTLDISRNFEGSSKVRNVVISDSNGLIIYSNSTEYSLCIYTGCSKPSVTYKFQIATNESFTFAAAGDFGHSNGLTYAGHGRDTHGHSNYTTRTLDLIAKSGLNFFLALGDLSYNGTGSENSWCNYVKSRVGATFPFELLAGNHEDDDNNSSGDGRIANFAGCLPDRIQNISYAQGYAKEYYFDYPSASPLARIIAISPGLPIDGVNYAYIPGNSHYVWLSNAIDGARDAGIPWVIVGMHVTCITAGQKTCEAGQDLMDLLFSKKVDLILQGHDHNYQRFKQLTCASVNLYNPLCVVDDGSDNSYSKGKGSVIVIVGTGGHTLYPINALDPEYEYVAVWMGENSPNPGMGFVKFNISTSQLSAEFLGSTTSFKDSFVIAEPTAASTSKTTTATTLPLAVTVMVTPAPMWVTSLVVNGQIPLPLLSWIDSKRFGTLW